MGKYRARKNLIRAHMAVTGTNYMRAVRDLSNGGCSYLRSEWSNSAWVRILPYEALHLETVISTATVHSQDGSLADLLAIYAREMRMAERLDSPLTWQSENSGRDSRQNELRELAESAFATAAIRLGHVVPATVGELADFLASVGVYQHTITSGGTGRWRTSEMLPDLLEVLPVPSEWVEREHEVEWVTRDVGPAVSLLRSLQKYRGQAQVDTTVEKLATEAAISAAAARNGLRGLMRRHELGVVRGGQTLEFRDLREVADHARITVMLDWDDENIIFDPDDDTESKFLWTAAPWLSYAAIAAHPDVSVESAELVNHFPFTMQKPDGGTYVTSLASSAAHMGPPQTEWPPVWPAWRTGASSCGMSKHRQPEWSSRSIMTTRQATQPTTTRSCSNGACCAREPAASGAAS